MGMENLDNYKMDVLREIGNIGAGNAATALAKMLDKKVDMKVPAIKVMSFDEVSNILGGAETPVVGILLGVIGDIQGYMMFILEQTAAKLLTNLLMNKGTDEELEYDDLTLSAMKEIGNILAGSYLSALSTLTNLRIMPDVPELAIDMAGAILSVPAIEYARESDSVLYIETEFTDGGDSILGDFFLIPKQDSYEKLLNTLGVK